MTARPLFLSYEATLSAVFRAGVLSSVFAAATAVGVAASPVGAETTASGSWPVPGVEASAAGAAASPVAAGEWAEQPVASSVATVMADRAGTSRHAF
ncbi:hypothetical protein SGRIM119S_07656 [Streptomyces griseorubiginosus]